MKNSFKSLFILFLAIGFLGGCAYLQSWIAPEEVVQAQKENGEAEGAVPQADEAQKTQEVQEALVVEPYFDANQVNRRHTRPVLNFCRKIDERFLHWGWGLSGCRDFPWHHVRDSVQGDPLMWTVFGDESELKTRDEINVTLVMCGVHGDEITPIKFCFDILHYLNEEFKKPEYKNTMVVVFPIASPDSFFTDRPSRVNARGVDINRNLPTRDWNADALRLWRDRYRSDPRRFPGHQAMSEPETLTQVNLIKRYEPQKIITVHAPLTILDYDGPVELTPHFGEVGSRASELLIQMSKKADGYEVRNYPFFPGSLGNYAGNERGIPTYTLELPSSDNRRHKEYWNLFRRAIRAALIHDLKAPETTSRVVENRD